MVRISFHGAKNGLRERDPLPNYIKGLACSRGSGSGAVPLRCLCPSGCLVVSICFSAYQRDLPRQRAARGSDSHMQSTDSSFT